MFQRLMRRDPLRRVQIRHPLDEIFEHGVVNVWPVRKWLVRDVVFGPLFPKHPQDLAIDFLVANVLHEPIQSFLVPKVRNLTLQANESRQRTLCLMFLKIVIRPEYNTPEHSVYALRVSARKTAV